MFYCEFVENIVYIVVRPKPIKQLMPELFCCVRCRNDATDLISFPRFHTRKPKEASWIISRITWLPMSLPLSKRRIYFRSFLPSRKKPTCVQPQWLTVRYESTHRGQTLNPAYIGPSFPSTRVGLYLMIDSMSFWLCVRRNREENVVL